MLTPHSIFHSVLKNLGRYSLLFPLVLLTGLVCITGCGQKKTDGKVKINGTVMLDGSPLICEGEGESYVNLVSETGENGGGSGSFDRSTGRTTRWLRSAALAYESCLLRRSLIWQSGNPVIWNPIR